MTTPPPNCGAVERITPDAVRGWAALAEPEARLRILVNGAPVATIPARMERPELLEAGLPLQCGFGHRFAQPLAPDDQVEVQLPDGTALPHRNGMVDKFAPDQIAGWAVEGTQGAALHIFINNQPAAQITAQRARPDLEKRGFPRLCGFLHVFDPPLTAGDTVHLRFADGAPLKGTPRQVERLYQGSLDRCTTLRIGGWASQGGTPVTIEILVNGAPLASILADRERPDLAARGLPVTSGFLHTLEKPLALTDTVSVRLPNGAELRNSPRNPGHQQDGALDMCSTARVVGWAAQDGAPATLELLINNEPAGQITCDVPRHDLAARGLPLLSGFAALLPRTLAPTDEVALRFPDGPLLAGSPKRPGQDYLAAPGVQAGVVQQVGNSRAALDAATISAAANLDLFAGLAVKEALLARHANVEEAFTAFTNLLTLPDCARLVAKKRASLANPPKRARLAWQMLDPGGTPYRLPAPSVIGDGNQYDLTGTSRPIFLGCLRDATLRGRSAVIELPDCALVDYQADELERLEDRLHFDPAVFAAADTTLHLIAPATAPTRTIPEAFHLLGAHTDAFGHWLWEYLPKYLAATMQPGLPPVPILIDAVQPNGVMPAAHRESLRAMAPPGTEFIELRPFETIRVEKLWVTPGQMHMPLLERITPYFRWDCLGSPPERLANVMREMDRRLPQRKGRGVKRVFLARPASNHRRLVNKLVIEGIAQARGFEIIYPETLDFAGQATLLREAEFVLGPEGSAFFLAFFARPGTQLCLLDHPHTAGMTLLTAPLETLGIHTVMFTGPFAQVEAEFRHCSDYSIDEVAFAQFLDRWLRGRP